MHAFTKNAGNAQEALAHRQENCGDNLRAPPAQLIRLRFSESPRIQLGNQPRSFSLCTLQMFSLEDVGRT